MRRLMVPAALLALLLVVALMVASALGRPGLEPPVGGAARVAQVDTGAYPEITLYVGVADAAGQPLGGLSSADFSVTEDGAPVELSGFGGAGTGPVSALLVLDRSGSMADEDKIEGAQAAAEAFVGMLRPGDRAALLPFNEGVDVVTPFTGDQAELREAIAELRADGGTALYDAVVAGVELLRNEPGRRLLLVLSDGQDCRVSGDGCPNEFGSTRTLDDALAYAQEAGQPVAVVGLGDRAGSGRDGIDEAVLRQMADATGGRYFYAPRADELAQLYVDLAGEVQQEYRLTYVSPRPFYDGTRRDIQVRVGGSVAAGGYTERHLINVVSSPIAGVVLLTPLVGLLLVPGLLRRRPGRAPTPVGTRPAEALVVDSTVVVPGAFAHAPAAPVMAPVAGGPAQGGAAPVVVVGTRRCVSCDAALREGARFCNTCGTVQPAPVAERRTFCDMCGQPLEPGAKFCMGCGEPVVKREAREA